MAARLSVDVGCTTLVAATQAGDESPRLVKFADEDGPAGTLTASLTWSGDGSARVGTHADLALDADPHRGVRGPLAHLEAGDAILELAAGPVPVTALVGELLARAQRAAATQLGDAPADAVLTIPAAWPPDGRRARALRAAAVLGGLPAVTIVPSAVAVAELVREAGGEIVLVCDVGGRTTQVSLVDLGAQPARLLAATELVVGADLFDELLYVEVLRRLAEHDADAARRLEDLQLRMAAADAEPDAPQWIACQGRLARAVRHCREALAHEPRVALTVPEPVGLKIELEREDVAALLATETQLVAGAAREQLARAGDVGRGATPRAVLVGGGAEAPGLCDALDAELGVATTIADAPVTAVARGALAATRARSAIAPVHGTPASPAPAPAPRPASVRQALRTVLEDVTVATLVGDEVVAVVRHDRHQRAVRADARGRVSAAFGVPGGEVVAVTATGDAVIVAGEDEASVLSADLRPLTTVARPLVAAAHGAVAWIMWRDEQAAPVLRLATLALERRAARPVEDARLGLAPAIVPTRRPRRAARPQPPAPHWAVCGERLLFAVAARGRAGRPAQLLGEALPAGLAGVQARGGPPWVTARAPTPAGAVAVLTGGDGGATALSLGEAEVASWPVGYRVRILAEEPHRPWVVAARYGRWEALRLDAGKLARVRTGDGTVEAILSDGDALWLVCESGGERRLVLVDADGALRRLAALSVPLDPVGRAGDEVLVLAGARGTPRRLVAIAPG